MIQNITPASILENARALAAQNPRTIVSFYAADFLEVVAAANQAPAHDHGRAAWRGAPWELAGDEIIDRDGRLLATLASGVPSSYGTLMAASPDLLRGVEAAIPWIAKLIADRVHENATGPSYAIRALDLLNDAFAHALPSKP